MWVSRRRKETAGVRLLVSAMNDEEADRKLRVEIAKELLSRVCGRGPVADGEQDACVRFVLEGDLARLAK